MEGFATVNCIFMIRTASLLIVTLIVFPLAAFWFGQALTPLQFSLLKTSGFIAASVALLCFTVSRLTGNCSQVDKIWSIMPVVYAWYFAVVSDWNARVVLMAVLISIWGVRLTYNFAKRGGYSWKFWEGEQDYRWDVLKQRPELKNPVTWMLFDLFFISLYQNGLIWLFTLPTILAADGSSIELTHADGILALLFMVFVIAETVADQQQWNFQNRKLKKKALGEKLTAEEAQGFISTGLWKFSRHPNYAAEQSIWLVLYGFSITATGLYINWSLAGALLLLLLFQGSSNFSEEVSAGKYPSYKDYQQRVGRYIPKFW
jgi:steroid 5-alpha reductase family enzyme